jgi:hypothetical protein
MEQRMEEKKQIEKSSKADPRDNIKRKIKEKTEDDRDADKMRAVAEGCIALKLREVEA